MLVPYSTLAPTAAAFYEPERANQYAWAVSCLKDRKRQQRQHTPATAACRQAPRSRCVAAPSCNHALFTRARQRQLYTRGKRSSAAGRTTRCGTEQQPSIYRERASGDDHLTRPETLSGNAMWKKLTTTPWRTEDARSDSCRRYAPVCCPL